MSTLTTESNSYAYYCHKLWPLRVIKAPKMQDNYYASLLDWNSNTNLIAYALNNILNIYIPSCDKHIQFAQESMTLHSVKFSPLGDHISFGMNGYGKVIDVCTQRTIRTINNYVSLTNIISSEIHLSLIENTSHFNHNLVITGSKQINELYFNDIRQVKCFKQSLLTPGVVSLKWSYNKYIFA
eukprot:133381_1